MTHNPSIGRIVRYYQGDWEAMEASMPHLMAGKTWEQQNEAVQKYGAAARGTNGHREHPAMITAVWGPDCVNLTVFFDTVPTPQIRSSASRLPDEVFAEGVHCANSGWRWPERV